MTESRFPVTTLEFEISFLQGSFTVLVKLSFWWTVPPLLRFDVCLTSFFVSFLYFLLLSLLYPLFAILSTLFYNYFLSFFTIYYNFINCIYLFDLFIQFTELYIRSLLQFFSPCNADARFACIIGHRQTGH